MVKHFLIAAVLLADQCPASTPPTVRISMHVLTPNDLEVSQQAGPTATPAEVGTVTADTHKPITVQVFGIQPDRNVRSVSVTMTAEDQGQGCIAPSGTWHRSWGTRQERSKKAENGTGQGIVALNFDLRELIGTVNCARPNERGTRFVGAVSVTATAVNIGGRSTTTKPIVVVLR